jgi:large subunit ribosomal protein L9
MASNIPVILARDVPNLGHVGELVNVRPGFARNFLLPQGLALPASPKRVAHFEHQKKLVEHKRRLLRGESEKKATEIAKVQVSLTVKVGDQGKIFGSVTSRDIARALAAQGYNIHHRDVKLGDPIKTVGLHTVDVRLEADVSAQVKVMIIGEVMETPPKEEVVEAAPAPAAEAAPAAAAPEAAKA